MNRMHAFVRRWCLHILPHGFTKTRSYGGWSNHHAKRYVSECRELKDNEVSDSQSLEVAHTETHDWKGHSCPQCGGMLEIVERVHRTSWRDVLAGPDCPAWNTFRERPG